MSGTRPDAFTERFTQAMRTTARDPGGPHPSPVRDQLAEDMETALRPVADQVIADVRRPYRRLIFWMVAGYVVFVGVSIVQAILCAVHP